MTKTDGIDHENTLMDGHQELKLHTSIPYPVCSALNPALNPWADDQKHIASASGRGYQDPVDFLEFEKDALKIPNPKQPRYPSLKEPFQTMQLQPWWDPSEWRAWFR